MAEPAPSGRELEILKVLWELGEASVRNVHEKMCPQGELAFNTIQTLLRIMEDKGFVKHRTKARTFIYYPKYTREQVTSRFLHKVFNGALDELVVSMLKVENVSSKELLELEQLIAKARREKRSRKQARIQKGT